MNTISNLTEVPRRSFPAPGAPRGNPARNSGNRRLVGVGSTEAALKRDARATRFVPMATHRPCASPPATEAPSGYVRNYAALELAAENLWTRLLFIGLGGAGAVAGLTCFWHLKAMMLNWSSFVEGWRSVLL